MVMFDKLMYLIYSTYAVSPELKKKKNAQSWINCKVREQKKVIASDEIKAEKYTAFSPHETERK